MARSYVRAAQNYQWKMNNMPPILKGSFRQMLGAFEYQQKCFLLVYRLKKNFASSETTRKRRKSPTGGQTAEKGN